MTFLISRAWELDVAFVLRLVCSTVSLLPLDFAFVQRLGTSSYRYDRHFFCFCNLEEFEVFWLMIDLFRLEVD